MAIKIISDTAADIPQPFKKELNISVVPMCVPHPGQSHRKTEGICQVA